MHRPQKEREVVCSKSDKAYAKTEDMGSCMSDFATVYNINQASLGSSTGDFDVDNVMAVKESIVNSIEVEAEIVKNDCDIECKGETSLELIGTDCQDPRDEPNISNSGISDQALAKNYDFSLESPECLEGHVKSDNNEQ